MIVDANGKPVGERQPAADLIEQPSRIVRITRSVTRKLNLGNYESIDFFCSRQTECFEEDSDAASEAIHKWCLGQVRADIASYAAERRQPTESEKRAALVRGGVAQ